MGGVISPLPHTYLRRAQEELYVYLDPVIQGLFLSLHFISAVLTAVIQT
jgi:hypothetical protein